MSIIYQPRGKAREYSPLALNIYLGCTHKCKYCYAPHCIQKKESDYFSMPAPRKNIVESLEKEMSKTVITEQVLLSFIGDVYCETADQNETTARVLTLLQKYNVPTAILTKGGFRCLKDLELFKLFGAKIHVGTTLTFISPEKSKEWEAGAALPAERLETLKILHDAGIKTFVSFEPVIEPEESLKLIERTLADDSVDIYKIGKINNYKGLDKSIDWSQFLEIVLSLIRPSGKAVYVKDDLRKAAPTISLFDNEMDPDLHCVR